MMEILRNILYAKNGSLSDFIFDSLGFAYHETYSYFCKESKWNDILWVHQLFLKANL